MESIPIPRKDEGHEENPIVEGEKEGTLKLKKPGKVDLEISNKKPRIEPAYRSTLHQTMIR